MSTVRAREHKTILHSGRLHVGPRAEALNVWLVFQVHAVS